MINSQQPEAHKKKLISQECSKDGSQTMPKTWTEMWVIVSLIMEHASYVGNERCDYYGAKK